MTALTFQFRCKVVNVVDGDTVDLEADLGFHVSTRFRTRLLGINAPERYATGGKAATLYLRGLLPVGGTCWATTFREPGDKFGRWLASILVETSAGPTDVAEAMIVAGHAVSADY